MKLWNALRQRNKRRSSKVENGILTLEGAEDTDCDPETEEGNDNRYPRSSSVPIELGLGTPNVTPCDDPTSQMKSYNDINLLQNGTSTPMRDSPVKNGLRVSPTRSQVNGRQPHTPKQQPSVNLPRNGSSFDKSFSSSQKKKSSNWFSMSSYKQKSEEFHKLFKDIPSDERLLVDYSCAMQKDLLVHGRIYVSQNWICFYANILFKWETTVVIPCHQIKSMTKEKTARFIPNAIQISTHTEKYFFSTFTSRDKSYLMMFRVWQNALLRQPLSGQELWQLVHDLYGTQLGLTASDDDYLPADSAQESDSAQAPEVSSIGDSGSAVTHQNLDMPVSQSLPASIDLVDTPPQDLFTDCTDTSEDECDEGEVDCPDGHEHPDWTTMDLVVNFTVEQIFDLLFTDTSFFRSFLDSQGTTDIVLGEWSDTADASGSKTRSNTFTIALHASFGPKTTPSCETQFIRKESKPGSFYCVDCESLNDPSLPYAENFYVWNRYCISRLTKSTSRVTVRSKICYRKSVFSLVKAIIDKNVRNGVNGYFKPLTEKLTQESEKVAANADQPRKKKRYTKHRNPPASRVTTHPSSGATGSDQLPPSVKQSTELSATRRTTYITSTVRVMSALLIFLVMFNLLLFCKLWSLESRHSALQYDSSNSGLYTHQDLLEILNKQKYLYEKDINHWKSTLESSSKLIQELKHSVEEIKAQQKISNSQLPLKDKVDL